MGLPYYFGSLSIYIYIYIYIQDVSIYIGPITLIKIFSVFCLFSFFRFENRIFSVKEYLLLFARKSCNVGVCVYVELFPR